MSAEETISHMIYTINNYTFPGYMTWRLLGKPFNSTSDFEILRNQNFDQLKSCKTKFNKTRGCFPFHFPLNAIVGWSGIKANENKTSFLKDAPQLLNLKSIPSDVLIEWEFDHPHLCFNR